MPERTTVHGFPIEYEQNSAEGVRYLRDDLDINEAKVFFDQAKMRGSAQFEDDEDRQFTIIYRTGLYILMRR